MKENFISCGNAFELIDEIDSGTVQSIITSPPYWGLRDYGMQEQLGLEPDFNDYLKKLIDFFDKCRKVLKKDGLLFVNLGDTYYGSGNNHGNHRMLSSKQRDNRGAQGQVHMQYDYSTCPRKSMIGIPQRFMVGMIDNGWICRNQIIWRKPNAMPSSVKDRFSHDYETIFMFSRHSRYKFNQMFEPMHSKDITNPRGSRGCLTKNSGLRGMKTKKDENDRKRNMRTVWDINNRPLKEAHFATFPEELVQRMLLCSTDEDDIVLDPFMGSGTVAKVAVENGRKYQGIELNQEYIRIIKKRIDI